MAKTQAYARGDGKVALTIDGSDLYWIDPSEVPDAIQQGYRVASPELGAKLQRSHSLQEDFISHVQGAARTYSGGATDWLGANAVKIRQAIGAPIAPGVTDPEDRAEIIAGADRLSRERWTQPGETAPVAGLAGEIGGFLLPGGAYGKAGKVGAAIAKPALARMAIGPGVAKGASRAIASTVEGAAISAGSAGSDIAVHHPEMTREQVLEHLIGATVTGAATMAVLHFAGTGVAKGHEKLKRFAKSWEPEELKVLKSARKDIWSDMKKVEAEQEESLMKALRARKELVDRNVALGAERRVLLEDMEIAATELAKTAKWPTHGSTRAAGPKVQAGSGRARSLDAELRAIQKRQKQKIPKVEPVKVSGYAQDMGLGMAPTERFSARGFIGEADMPWLGRGVKAARPRLRDIPEQRLFGTQKRLVRARDVERQVKEIGDDLAKLDKGIAAGKLKTDKAVKKLWMDGVKLTRTIQKLKEEVGTSLVGRAVTNIFGIFAGTAAAGAAGTMVSRAISGGYGQMAGRSVAWRAFRWLQGASKASKIGKLVPPVKSLGMGYRHGGRVMVDQITSDEFHDIMERLELDELRYSDVKDVNPTVGAALDAVKDNVKAHLMEKAPKPLVDRPGWKPSGKQLTSFSKTIRAAVRGPDGIFEDIASGYTDRESIEYMQIVDPEGFAWLQSVAAAIASSGTADAARMAVLAIILGQPGMSNMHNYSRTMRLQSLYDIEAQESASRAQLKSAQSSQTNMQSIEARAQAA
jgi:hypothetical protein